MKKNLFNYRGFNWILFIFGLRIFNGLWEFFSELNQWIIHGILIKLVRYLPRIFSGKWKRFQILDVIDLNNLLEMLMKSRRETYIWDWLRYKKQNTTFDYPQFLRQPQLIFQDDIWPEKRQLNSLLQLCCSNIL